MLAIGFQGRPQCPLLESRVWSSRQFVPEETASVSIIGVEARIVATIENRRAVRPAVGASTAPNASGLGGEFGESLRGPLASLVTKMTGSPVAQQRRFTPDGRAYWEFKRSVPKAEMVTTPTATAVLETEWPTDCRFFKSPTGRWRKRTKKGIEGSMNWAQEMLVRAVTQRNTRLMPTAEACESFMGFPVGWTDPARKGTASDLCSASTRSFFAAQPAADDEGRNHADKTQVTVTPKPSVTVPKTNSEGNTRMKTASEFDQWLETKRERPVGICNECGREKELRQREPEPLCGACYMKIDRQEKKAADPLAVIKDAKKRDKKIRAEMCKVLNVVDALEGLVSPGDLKQLERVAKKHLRPIIEAPDSDGHVLGENERDQAIGPDYGSAELAPCLG